MLTIQIGADHGGFNLKEAIKAQLTNEGYTVVDQGAASLTPDDDFPDFGAKVAHAVSLDPENARGILICRSGFGMDIVANKFPGIRAGLPLSPDHISQGRHDDDLNVLILAADFVDQEKALQLVKTFLATPYASEEERRQRRLNKIKAIEEGKE